VEDAVVQVLINSPDYIQCEKMFARIRKDQCVNFQRIAARGEPYREHGRVINPANFIRCLSCTRGREILKEDEAMGSVIGQCKNCGREGLKVESGGRGFCGSCRGIAAKIKDPEEQAKALAAVKERLQAKEVKKQAPPLQKKATKQRKPKAIKNSSAPVKGSEKIEPVFSPTKSPIQHLIHRHNSLITEAQEIFFLLLGLRKYGAEFELPVHIMEVKSD
jgi:hypothetical protein